MPGESKSSKARQFQAPKGTRDFYPQDMAVRRYIEGVWRTTSINHGFDEVEGPTFEYLDLYTHKSGPGIASELFQVFSGKDEAERAEIQKTGQAPFALRPEFTPTLARMVAAKAGELPRPIKWFAIPSHFRAERPQRGRLREFMQWNVDFIGDDSPRADAEVIATAVGALQILGLKSQDITVRLSHRGFIASALQSAGVSDSKLETAMMLLDKKEKLEAAAFASQCEKISLDVDRFAGQTDRLKGVVNQAIAAAERGEPIDSTGAEGGAVLGGLLELVRELSGADVLRWCEFDPSIVRGLAYYTGTVFEIHESTGAERAIAGGGRYDNLIESFGGPKLPACGFGMGDVVLGNILHDKGLLPEEAYMEALRPHAFVIAADDDAASKLTALVAALRKGGFHIRHSYKTTRNVGKLLGDAAKSRARYAIILGKELAQIPPRVAIKDLATGEQTEATLTRVAEQLRAPKLILGELEVDT